MVPNFSPETHRSSVSVTLQHQVPALRSLCKLFSLDSCCHFCTSSSRESPTTALPRCGPTQTNPKARNDRLSGRSGCPQTAGTTQFPPSPSSPPQRERRDRNGSRSLRLEGPPCQLSDATLGHAGRCRTQQKRGDKHEVDPVSAILGPMSQFQCQFTGSVLCQYQ